MIVVPRMSGATTVSCEHGNYRTQECNRRGAFDVGASSPAGDGAFGQADLGGNAWEWNLDSYAPQYGGSCTDCVHVASVLERVIRGGGFNDGPYWVANTNRFYATAAKRQPSLGLRCARVP